MKKTIAIVLCAIATTVTAQTIDAPVIKSGDTWAYRETVDKGAGGWNETHNEVVATRATSTRIYFSVKPVGSNLQPRELVVGSDWSRSRSLNGVETVINQPLSFPLRIDKSWETVYTELHPNKLHSAETWNSHYKVVGVETVDVPAGRFNALKIESEGTWTAQMEAASTVSVAARVSQGGVASFTDIRKSSDDPASGRTYKAFWYAPEVKRWVKSVEEYYSSSNTRTEKYSSELESFKLVD